MYFHSARSPVNTPHCYCRFLGIYGAYSSVQYLSLSDATVLTFIAPILTGFSGAVFLKEPFSIGEVLAGCTYLESTITVFAIHQIVNSMQLLWGRIDLQTTVSFPQFAGASGSV